jgi:hypothetical protein
MADQIWVWNTMAGDWDKYFYKLPNQAWFKSTDTTTPTTDVLPVGQGVFFYRGSGAQATTITFKGPNYIEN